MTTDQAERGASTVSSGRLAAHTEDTLTTTEATALEAFIARPYVQECEQLTAERDALREAIEHIRITALAGLDAIRKAKAAADD